MITQRRLFQAKVGQAGHVVAKIKEFESSFERFGGSTNRIYTDMLSGKTDRVVWEFDTESLTSLESTFQEVGQDPEYQKAFGKWFQELLPLIESATVELWKRES